MSLRDVLTEIADTIRKYEIEELITGGLDDESHLGTFMKLDWMPGKIRSIVEKVKENYRRLGYDEGRRVGKEEGTTAGRKAEYDSFWDTFQENGKRVHYNHAFYAPSTTVRSWWNDDTFRPKYPIICKAGNAGDCMLTSSMVTRIPVRIEVYSNAYQTEYLLYNNPYLHTVDELWVQEGCTFDNWFTGDTALKNLRMYGVVASSISFADCPELTNESVQSVIGVLKDFTGTTARTLTVHKSVYERMTSAQKDAIFDKNWTLAY